MTDTMWKGYIEVRNLRELPDDEHFPITDFLSRPGAASSRIAICRASRRDRAGAILRPIAGCAL